MLELLLLFELLLVALLSERVLVLVFVVPTCCLVVFSFVVRVVEVEVFVLLSFGVDLTTPVLRLELVASIGVRWLLSVLPTAVEVLVLFAGAERVLFVGGVL